MEEDMKMGWSTKDKNFLWLVAKEKVMVNKDGKAPVLGWKMSKMQW